MVSGTGSSLICRSTHSPSVLPVVPAAVPLAVPLADTPTPDVVDPLTLVDAVGPLPGCALFSMNIAPCWAAASEGDSTAAAHAALAIRVLMYPFLTDG